MVCALCALTLAPGVALAQEPDVELRGSRLWVETDLFPWLGAGFMVRAGRLLSDTGVSVAVEAFGQNLDPVGTALFVSGNPRGIDARLQLGIDALARYHFSGGLEGFNVGLSIGGERFRVRPEEAGAGADQRYFNVFVAPRAAYTWFPGRANELFYITGEVVLVVPVLRSAAVTVGDELFSLRAAVLYPALGAGFAF